MNIEWEQVQLFSVCVILNATVGVEICAGVCIPYFTNKLIITNTADGRTRINKYPTDGN